MSDSFIALIGGVVLLLFSTRSFLKQSQLLSHALKLSPLIIGMTVVAIGTSIPELSVSTIASAKGDIALALGNIVGSNIVNILLVFGVAILIGNLRIGTTKTPRNAVLLLIVTVLFSASHIFNMQPKYLTGLFFIISVLFVTLIEYKWALFGRVHEDAIKLNDFNEEKFSVGKLIMLFLAVIGVVIGGYLVVDSIEMISLLTGLSTGVLGLTLTAVATSLPELLTTIFSQEQHDEKMTIGNILGSNIYNLLLIGGLIDLFSPELESTGISWILLIIVTLFFVSLMLIFRGKVIPKYIGVICLIMFVGYIILETKPLY